MQQLELIFNSSRLPRTAKCTNDFANGVHLRRLKHALKHKYVEINPPNLMYWMTFDVDRPGACYAWEDANVAMPNFATINPDNAHAHLIYGLQVPVYTCDAARENPLRFANAIINAYNEFLKADKGYSGLITKNPLHDSWRLLEGHCRLWDLGELAEYIPNIHKFNEPLRHGDKIVGIGRNVTLFDLIRFWAYKAIREFRGGGSEAHKAWHAKVYEHAQERNGNFSQPLEDPEVKALAKSIAKWCWAMDPYKFDQFIARQSYKGRIGGKIGGKLGDSTPGGRVAGRIRSAKYEKVRQEAIRLSESGCKVKEIAEQLGVHRNSVSNWIKAAAKNG